MRECVCGVLMDDEFRNTSPPKSEAGSPRSRLRSAHRSASTSRLHRHGPGAAEDARHRMRTELHLTRELIDFDVIKGCVSVGFFLLQVTMCASFTIDALGCMV